MTTFSIPSDPDQADDLASELGELASAAEWKRAALVYARVHVSTHGGDRSKVNSDLADDKISPKQYALRGIHGLRSQTTVRRYWQAWDNLVAEGKALPVSLGDEIELPDEEWADYYTPQNHSTPPYFVPFPSEIAERTFARSEDLPMGNCPPVASNIDEPEPNNRLKELLERLERSRQENQNPPIEKKPDPELAKRLAVISLDGLWSLTQSTLKIIQDAGQIDDDSNRDEMLEHLNNIRNAVGEMERAIRGESIDDEQNG